MTRASDPTHEPASRNERRKNPRAPAFCRGFAWLETTLQEVICLNVSETGMAVRFDPLPSVGQIARFEISLPSRAQIIGTAEVVHLGGHRPDEVGLRFVSVSPEATDALKIYVAGAPDPIIRF